MSLSNVASNKLSPITSQMTRALPPCFRVTAIQASISPKGNQVIVAQLSHFQADIKVMWQTKPKENIVLEGDLIEIKFETDIRSYSGMLIVDGLSVISIPSHKINLFNTVPRSWVKQHELIVNAAQLFEHLPDYFKALLNGTLWNSDRFKRFLTGPSSMKGHHHYLNGNLIHTLDVIERAMAISAQSPKANLAIVMMGAWMHDIGKADEYAYDHVKGCFEMSDRGVLVGHKISAIEWLCSAKAKYDIQLPDQIWMSLLHTLTAIKGAPEWMGLREPVTPESLIISTADRLSGQNDLFEQTTTEHDGFGKYHRHLKGRAYVLAA